MKTTSKKIKKINEGNLNKKSKMKTTSKNEDDLKKKMKTNSKKNEDDLKKNIKKIGCDIIVN